MIGVGDVGRNDALVQLFTRRTASYDRFIRFGGYPQGLHAFFRRSVLLRAGLAVLDAVVEPEPSRWACEARCRRCATLSARPDSQAPPSTRSRRRIDTSMPGAT